MKWLIVEDALRDRKGHWVEYVSTFVRELRALGDEVVVLCDHKAQGFVMEQTGARPVLPESIWHRMGDGAGALKRYLRVPGHALATFFAMRKFFKKFNHRGHREHRVGVDTQGEAQGNAQRTCAGSSESGSLSSKLADSPVSESPIRRANGPASSPVTSHSLQATTPEASLPATIYQLHATSSPPDWIFVPTVLVHHLLGWWMLLKTGSVPKESRVLLFFPNSPIQMDDKGQPFWFGGPTTKLMAWLFENLRGEVESGKVVLGVETHAMRRALEGLIRMPVVYLPHPVPAKPGQGEARGEGREARDGAGFPAETQGRGDFQTTNHTKLHERGEAGQRLAGQAGVSESDSLASELADSPVSESLISSADGPASALEPGRSSLDTASPATSNSPPDTSAKPIVFGCYGAARWEKGSDIFQEAIRLILRAAERRVAPEDRRSEIGDRAQHGAGSTERGAEEKPEKLKDEGAKALDSGRSTLDISSLAPSSKLQALRFCIQWVEDFRDGDGNLVSIDPWLREHPQVEVIGRYFQGGEYEQQLAQTDVMVLPYRSPYQLRVSRVVIEAMLNGMPVIATCGTTLFDQAEEYGVVVGCDEGDAMSLAKAMLEVADRFAMLRAEAEEKVNAAVESFSVGYFRELLWRLCRREPQSENG